MSLHKLLRCLPMRYGLPTPGDTIILGQEAADSILGSDDDVLLQSWLSVQYLPSLRLILYRFLKWPRTVPTCSQPLIFLEPRAPSARYCKLMVTLPIRICKNGYIGTNLVYHAASATLIQSVCMTTHGCQCNRKVPLAAETCLFRPHSIATSSSTTQILATKRSGQNARPSIHHLMHAHLRLCL